MIFIFLSATFLSLLPPTTLLENASTRSQVYQTNCLKLLPTSTVSTEALGALLCGKSLDDLDLKESLQRLSLIHLFVVSGSHLIWIEQILGILKIPSILRSLLLLGYALLTGWQPPAVRALLQLYLKLGLRFGNIYLPPDLRILLSGFLTLALFPKWWNSLSLLMSWSASLALTWNFSSRGSTLNWQKILLSQSLIWLMMLAPLWGLGSLHPLSCLYNLILGPLIAFLLLPLALAASLWPTGFMSLFDSLLSYLLAVTPTLTEPILHNKDRPLQASNLWLWITVWHLAFHGLRIFVTRRKEQTL